MISTYRYTATITVDEARLNKVLPPNTTVEEFLEFRLKEGVVWLWPDGLEKIEVTGGKKRGK